MLDRNLLKIKMKLKQNIFNNFWNNNYFKIQPERSQGCIYFNTECSEVLKFEQ